MTNPEILFLVLRLLEQSPLTAEQLWLQASGKGPDRSMKTFRRGLTDLENFGIKLNKNKTLYQLPEKAALCPGFASFLKSVLDLQATWRAVCYGDFDRRAIIPLLAEKARPVEFVWQLLDAAVASKRIEFLYEPQHAGTRENLRWVRSVFKIGTPKDRLPVSMIPHYLVFSAQHFLILGEALIGGEVQVRQYEVAGIEKVVVHKPELRQLQINAAELYQHSVNIWVGGSIHEIELMDISEPGERRQKIKVNGEDEILSAVMGSLGKLRIVDPPDEVRRRAEQLGLPEDMVFRFQNGN